MKNKEWMSFKVKVTDESGPIKIIPELIRGLLYDYFSKIQYPILTVEVKEENENN